MEDLGLVFGDLDMGAEEASIEAAGGGLEEWDVGFSREDELDGTAPAGDALEGTEEAAGWQEVGGDDLDLAWRRSERSCWRTGCGGRPGPLVMTWVPWMVVLRLASGRWRGRGLR